MPEPVISVNNLSKLYRIGAKENSNKTFREAIIDGLTAPLRNFRRLRKLTNFDTSGPNQFDQWNQSDSSDTIWALKDVSFEVQPGEVVGIIGRNGAGKTTLLKILSRITEPSEGAVDLTGRVSSLLEVGTGFHPELTGRENIFLNGAILGMSKKEIEEKYDEIVNFSGIEKFIDTPVKRYSSGMYVRLAFAVASYLEPEILLVDEVLAVGDADFQKKCLGRMHDVSLKGRTVFFVSHNMFAIKSLCSRCILLEEGRSVTDGSPHEVVNRYLNAGFVSKAERQWNDPKEAPTNQVVRWLGAKIRNEKGEITADIESDHSFTLELDYCNLREGARLGTTMALFNEEGIHVLTSLSNHCKEWHNRSREEGIYRSICKIPGNLLTEGKYSVTFLTWVDNYSSLHREDNVLEFQVNDTGFVRGDYYDETGGIIKPLLEWKTYKM